MIETVDAECLVLCRNEKETSPFKRMTLEQLTEFKWYTFVQELETKAPTLWNMLTTIVSHSQWIREGSPVKIVRDNVDKKKGVRDVRSDHRSKLLYMYSMFTVKERVSFVDEPNTRPVHHIASVSPSSFLPDKDDLISIRHTLSTLVGRILCKYISCLSQLSKQVTAHEYSDNMVRCINFFLDVLMKNEADMVDIMLGYLGEDTPPQHKVLSGGDQLTCERQVGAQRHRMDGDTPIERLELVEPQACTDVLLEGFFLLACSQSVCVGAGMYECMCLCAWEGAKGW